MQEKKFNLTKKALILAILFLVFHLILSFLRGELNFMVPPLLTFIVDAWGRTWGRVACCRPPPPCAWALA